MLEVLIICVLLNNTGYFQTKVALIIKSSVVVSGQVFY